MRLRRDEAGLPRASVVNISQVRTIDRTRLGDRAGALAGAHLREVLQGLAPLFGADSSF